MTKKREAIRIELLEKAEAMIDAAITLTGWMLLGLLAAVAFVAWRLVDMYLSETRRR